MSANPPSEPSPDGSHPAPATRRASGATRVAAGILASRVAGLVRDRVLAHAFGADAYADVFRTALRGPNVLQNLLGEGTLSASFIPIYSRLLAEGRREEAGRFAGAVFGLLLAMAGAFALLGVVGARFLVAALTPGYLRDAAGGAAVDRFPLAVEAVRYIFPMTGVLVLSAWALGVLNSHRRFFLAYFAPVLWNAAIVAGVWWALQGGRSAEAVLRAACVGALVGGVLQFVVQLPLVARLVQGFRLSASLAVPGVRAALATLGPAMAGRGALQLAAYLDQWLASFLAVGAVASLGFALALYALPAALFGSAVAAAELPELSASTAAGDRDAALRARLDASVRSVGFASVAAAVAYAAFGFVVVGALYRTGRFDVPTTWLTYLVLAGFTVGLVPGGCSRLLQNGFYALRDARTPARIAILRVGLSALLGVPAMLLFDRVALADVLGTATPLRLGAVGLSLGTGLAAWLELVLLARDLRTYLPGFRLPGRALARMAGIAALSALPGALAWWPVRSAHPVVQAALVLAVYGGGYLALSHAFHVDEARAWTRRMQTLVRRGRKIPS